MNLSKTAAIVAFLGWLCIGCQSIPLEQKYTLAELRERVNEPMPRCVKQQCEIKNGTINCWLYEPYMGKFVQPEECLSEFHDWQKKIADGRAALQRRYNAQAATAPECVRKIAMPREFLELLKVNPDSPDAIAQALARGVVVPSVDKQCMAKICEWRTLVEPKERCLYCGMDSQSLAGRELTDIGSVVIGVAQTYEKHPQLLDR